MLKLFLPFLICITASFPLLSAEMIRDCKDCNLIIISLTSLRKKNMSLYGYKRDTTPTINKFFEKSYLFENAIAPASLTYTDAVSLFFSLSPQIHRAYVRAKKEYTSETLKKYSSLADVLKQNGYSTAAFVSDEDYEYGWGIGRTFNYYFDRSYYADYGIKFKPFTYTVGTKQLVPLAAKWLDENKKKKKFLFLQAYDMHCPFTPYGKFNLLYDSPHSKTIPFTEECFMARDKLQAQKKDGKDKFLLKSFFAFLDKKEKKYWFEKQDLDYLISRYDAELNQADENLSPLFNKIKELGLDKNSIIVFLSEHGDYMGENGYFFKTSPVALGNLHNVNLNFPLAIKMPDVGKKEVKTQMIQTIDLAPSFLDLLGIKPPSQMQGKSFKNSLKSELEINDYAYSNFNRVDYAELKHSANSIYHLEAIQNKKWKLEYSAHYTFPGKKFIEENYFLYDLQNDPNELSNVSNKFTDIYKTMKNVLESKRLFYEKKS